MAITEGRTPNHMLASVLEAALEELAVPPNSETRFMARSMPYWTLLV